MNENQQRSLSFLCGECRQTVIVTKDLFSLSVAPVEIPCPCGKTKLGVHFQAEEVELKIPCHVCGKTHTVTIPSTAFVGQNLLTFVCPTVALPCFLLGEESAVFHGSARMEKEADLWVNRTEDGPYLNSAVMEEVLLEIKEIAKREGLSCVCGSQNWTFNVDYTSVALECVACGNVSRVPASLSEDVESICKCYTFQIGNSKGASS